MYPGSVAKGRRGNIREAAMVLQSCSSAQLVVEVAKDEMDSTGKSCVEANVLDLTENRKPKKNIFLKRIGWKRSEREKAVITTEDTRSKGIEDGSRDVSSVHKDETGMSTGKDGEKSNLIMEIDKTKKAKKNFWQKKLRRKMKEASSKVEKEINPRVTTEKGIKGIGNDFEESPCASTYECENVTRVKNVETSRNVDSSLDSCIPENAKKEKGNRLSLLNKLKFTRKNSSGKAEKGITPQMRSKRRRKRKGNYFKYDPTLSTNKSRNVATLEIGGPSRVESTWYSLTPEPAQKKKTKKMSWLKKLRKKKSDAGDGTSVSSTSCGNVALTKKIEPSESVPTDILIHETVNKQEHAKSGLPSLNEFENEVTKRSDNTEYTELAQQEKIVSSISENNIEEWRGTKSNGKLGEKISKRGKAMRIGLEENETEIVKSLPRLLKPINIPVDVNKRGLNFPIEDAQPYSNDLPLHQKREVGRLYDEGIDAKGVWIAPEIQTFHSKIIPSGRWLYIDLTVFCDTLFTTMSLQPPSLNDEHHSLQSINQRPSKSEDCHFEVATYGFWNFLWILMGQLDFGRLVSTAAHTSNVMDTFGNSERMTRHLSSVPEEDANDRRCSAFAIEKFTSTEIGVEFSKYVIQGQKQKSHPGNVYGCDNYKEKESGDNTAIIAQMCNSNHHTPRLNIKLEKMFVHAMKTECFGYTVWNTLKIETLPHVCQQEQAHTSTMDFSSEQSLPLGPASTLQNSSRCTDLVESSKCENLRLSGASPIQNVVEISIRVEVNTEKRNPTRLKFVPNRYPTIENLLLNSYVEYMEKERSSLVESVNALKRENEEMKAENKRIMVLLEGMVDRDRRKGTNIREVSAPPLSTT